MMKLYHIEHWLFLHHFKILSYVFKIIIRIVFSAVIPPSAKIGKGSFITYHGLGVVIHKDAIIGENCCIRQNVTIAGGNGGVPIIGNNVEINAGVVIIGPVHIGNNVRIGANAVVINDIPNDCTVVGVPAKPVRFYESGKNIFKV